MDNNISLRKKIKYYIGVAILLFILLLGSVFVSPTMNNALAKVPFLNLIFEPKHSINSIVVSIHEKLIKEDYRIENVFLDPPNKIIKINIKGTEQYYNDVKENIEKEVNNFLTSYDLDAYMLEVVHYRQKESNDELTEGEKEKIEDAQELEKAIMNEPKLQDYELISAFVSINDVEKFISLVISVTETRIEEIKRILYNIVREKNMDGFTIKIFSVDPEKEKTAQRWRTVVSSINDGLMRKKELKVEEVHFSFYETPLIFSIKTSIKSTDPNAEEIAWGIENTIREFIESDEVVSIVKGDPYNIIIYSRDEKIINISQ